MRQWLLRKESSFTRRECVPPSKVEEVVPEDGDCIPFSIVVVKVSDILTRRLC